MSTQEEKAIAILQKSGKFSVKRKLKNPKREEKGIEPSKVTKVPGWGNIFNSQLYKDHFQLSIELGRFVSQAEAKKLRAKANTNNKRTKRKQEDDD